jgi:hypothetical protein
MEALRRPPAADDGDGLLPGRARIVDRERPDDPDVEGDDQDGPDRVVGGPGGRTQGGATRHQGTDGRDGRAQRGRAGVLRSESALALLSPVSRTRVDADDQLEARKRPRYSP